MCMKATEEGCILSEQQKNLADKVKNIDERLTNVEADVGKMRSESQDGFRAINSSLSNLAHDFGQRFSNIEAVAVQEKAKWGDTLRSITKWAVKVLLLGAAVAMGVNIAKSFWQ